MFVSLSNRKWFKTVVVFLLLCFTNSVINPLQIKALTSGPSQPESQGFSPVETTQMVDLFTGDFKYEVPLMSIPGPDGDYPLVLNYNAGPKLEEEASWVGLGWSLNPGSISREVRGLPDDFYHQPIVKENNIKVRI